VITINFNKMPVHPGAKILDIGCGQGRHTCEAIRLKKLVVIGADKNFDDVVNTKEKLMLHQNLGEVKGRWGLSVSDIRCLPFRNHCFDGVICAEVLEHLPEQDSAISELRRVLKPGKMLAISVPRYLPERICWAISREYRTTENGHIRIYKKNELSDLIEKKGFKRVGNHYAHSLHTPYWWLKCLVGPAKEDALLINLYHRFLTWDIMKQPAVTHMMEHLLNPILGKSLVFYFIKRTKGSPIIAQ